MPPDIQELIKALDNTDSAVRARSVTALIRFGAAAIEGLCKALDDTNVDVRALAAYAIAEIEISRAEDALHSAMRFGDGEVEAGVPAILARFGSPPDTLPRRIICSKASVSARAAALNALHSWTPYYLVDDGDPDCDPITARQYCERLKSDTDPQVREAAAEVLRFLAD